MTANDIVNSNGAVMEREVEDLNSKAAQQVSEILDEASLERKVPRPIMAYRVPAAGVRYYF